MVGLCRVPGLFYALENSRFAIGADLRIQSLEPLSVAVVFALSLGIMGIVWIIGKILRQRGCEQVLVLQAGIAEGPARVGPAAGRRSGDCILGCTQDFFGRFYRGIRDFSILDAP